MVRSSKIFFYYGIVISFLVVVFVLSAEMILREKGKFKTWLEKNGQEYASPYQSSDSWYLTLTPNSKGTYDQIEFDFDRHTNSLGFRDKEWDEQKPKGVKRILTLGDSYTEGQGAELENSYPKVLQKELRKQGISVEVLNAGRAGSDPFYQYVLLRDKLYRYSPDLVLVMINRTDIKDVIARGGMERFHDNGTVVPPRQPGKIEIVYKYSHLFRFIYHKILRRNSLFLPRDQMDSLGEGAQQELVDVAKLFDDLGKEKSFSFLVIIQPTASDLHKAKLPMPTMTHLLSAGNIPFLEATPLMKKRLPPDHLINQINWKKDRHYNAKGYALLANVILSGLVAKKLIAIPEEMPNHIR